MGPACRAAALGFGLGSPRTVGGGRLLPALVKAPGQVVQLAEPVETAKIALWLDRPRAGRRPPPPSMPGRPPPQRWRKHSRRPRRPRTATPRAASPRAARPRRVPRVDPLQQPRRLRPERVVVHLQRQKLRLSPSTVTAVPRQSKHLIGPTPHSASRPRVVEEFRPLHADIRQVLERRTCGHEARRGKVAIRTSKTLREGTFFASTCRNASSHPRPPTAIPQRHL